MNQGNAIWMPGSRTGVLLIHGLTGTPSEMRSIARDFHRAGHSVYVVQLAGHCGSTEDLLATHWHDWYLSVVEGADALRQHVDHLFVGGLSMGAVLALKYAADFDVDGVLAYGPTFRADGWNIPWWSKLGSPLLPLIADFQPFRQKVFSETEPYGIRNDILRRRIVNQMNSGNSAAAGLPGTPWPSAGEMIRLSRLVRRQLWQIIAPCLVLHAEQDDIAHYRNALLVRDNVSGPVDMVLLKNSYHMITIDNDREEVITRSLAFIETQVAQAPALKYVVNPHNPALMVLPG